MEIKDNMENDGTERQVSSFPKLQSQRHRHSTDALLLILERLLV